MRVGNSTIFKFVPCIYAKDRMEYHQVPLYFKQRI